MVPIRSLVLAVLLLTATACGLPDRPDPSGAPITAAAQLDCTEESLCH